MILNSLTVLLLAATAADKPSDSTPTSRAPTTVGTPRAPKRDRSMDAHRLGFAELMDSTIGATSRSVLFDWRTTSVALGLQLSDLTERNNYDSLRAGAYIRLMLSSLYATIGISKVFARSTDSSRKLAQTPYRQYGRPNRIEIDLGLAYPIAEGVITTRPRSVPAVEIVLSISAELRYLYYPGALQGAGFRSAALALFRPTLTDREKNNLQSKRLAGMEVDAARYGLLAGLTTDLYFRNGLFLFPKVLCAVPVFSRATESKLGLWWELTGGVGYAF